MEQINDGIPIHKRRFSNVEATRNFFRSDDDRDDTFHYGKLQCYLFFFAFEILSQNSVTRISSVSILRRSSNYSSFISDHRVNNYAVGSPVPLQVLSVSLRIGYLFNLCLPMLFLVQNLRPVSYTAIRRHFIAQNLIHFETAEMCSISRRRCKTLDCPLTHFTLQANDLVRVLNIAGGT